MERVARDDFGHDGLLPGQRETVEAVVEGRDVLLVAPTGAGKSLTFQVAGRLLDGPVLVVSPLLALEQDQVEAVAAAPGDVAAARLSSAESQAQRDDALARARSGEVGYLFCSPELLADVDLRAAIAATRPALLVVDEAHCVSTWGADFRPDYQRLDVLARDLGVRSVLAMTATAAAPVREEICERLAMRDPLTVVTGFARAELALAVRRCRDEDDQSKVAGGLVREEVAQGHGGIVYARTRPAAERLAARLAEELDGTARVACYHAGLTRKRRERVHEEFMAGEVDVVVATSAFGMGIDKPDVRFVLHVQAPESLDTYWQEAGRAGRDGADARTTLLYRPEDLSLGRFFSGGVPSRKHLRHALGAAPVDLAEADPAEVSVALPFGRRKTGRLLNLLRLAQVGLGTDASAEDLVEAALALAEARRRLERSRVDMVRHYAESARCRSGLVLGYFGEAGSACGCCDNCTSGSAAASEQGDAGSPYAGSPYAVDARVTHATFGAGVVTDTADGEVTVLFDDHGYRTLDAGIAQAKRLLRVS